MCELGGEFSGRGLLVTNEPQDASAGRVGERPGRGVEMTTGSGLLRGRLIHVSIILQRSLGRKLDDERSSDGNA